MKLKIDGKIVCLIIGLALGISFSANMVSAYYSEPGSTSDPVVTLSYVEMKIEQLKEELRKEFSGSTTSQIPETTIANGSSSTEETQSAVFKVIELKAGDKIYLGESTEFILRAGEALTIEGPGGGLADLTTGIDLKNNEAVPLNHLNLASRGDGRGLSATTDGWILIKGKYTLIKK
ncbi:MAG: hypothetical protein WBA54_14275 [Acidaminobacteraceae bacterium]